MKKIAATFGTCIRLYRTFYGYAVLGSKSFSYAVAVMVLLHIYYTPYDLRTLPWRYLIMIWGVIAVTIVCVDKLSDFIDYLKNLKYGCAGVMLNYNSEACDRSLWEKLPTYEQLRLLNRTSEDGAPRCWCGSIEIKDWGLENTADHQRVHVCARCNYGVYRSVR